MQYYQEITLLPDVDISLGFLWQKLYQQVHIALVDNKVAENQSNIALGFPQYGNKGFPLGNKLRLFAQEQAQLEELNIAKWLTRLSDYLHVKSIQPVPEQTEQVAFVRRAVKGTSRIEKDMLKKALLWSEKSGQSLEQCLRELEKSKPSSDNQFPFVWLSSEKTKRDNPEAFARFPLFIEKIELHQKTDGIFNCYGLSLRDGGNQQLATTPDF